MGLPPKKVVCQCGHHFEANRYRSWCTKCGEPVYYDPKDRKHHKHNQFYVTTILLAVVTFLTYIFIEMIAKPLL